MPFPIAIGDGAGTVATYHGCDTVTTTDKCSGTVFINHIGVVRAGDTNTPHTVPPDPPCPTHTVALSIYSPTVFVEGVGVGRMGDKYGAEEITDAGQISVFADGFTIEDDQEANE